MIVWVDAQLSPRTANWITSNFPVTAVPLRDLGLQGSPPKILWLTCGNTSDAALQQILAARLDTALDLLAGDENLVEIGSP